MKTRDGKKEKNPEELSEYEMIRQANIEEREQIFEELGLINFRECLSVRVRPQKKSATENLEPVRNSRRIAGRVPEIERHQSSFDEYPLDSELEAKPRRRLAHGNYNDNLHATKKHTGNEEPESLKEISKERFNILKVPKKCTIKQFVLSNNLEFKTGRGFYEFTKPEIISYKKEVVLVEKKTGEMFSGRDAARMIGGDN